MAYFDPNKGTVLIVDASPVGLAALLTQDNKIIAYANRPLTHVENRYSQTEKEGLAIVWFLERFHLYLYGHKFTLVSDHQPLETIFNNPIKVENTCKNRKMEIAITTVQFQC